MAQNFIQDGKVITHVVPNATTIAAGDVVVIGNLTGVALLAGTAGQEIEVMVEGVFRLPKDSPLVINQGDRLFWNTTDKEVTKTATDRPLGLAVRGALSAATVVDVALYDDGVRFSVAANVAQNATANGSDAGTTQALANSLKTSVNAILTALKNAGLMVAD